MWCHEMDEDATARGDTVRVVGDPIYDGSELGCEAEGLAPFTAYEFTVAVFSTFQKEAAEVTKCQCRTLEDLARPPTKVGAIMDGFEVRPLAGYSSPQHRSTPHPLVPC